MGAVTTSRNRKFTVWKCGIAHVAMLLGLQRAVGTIEGEAESASVCGWGASRGSRREAMSHYVARGSAGVKKNFLTSGAHSMENGLSDGLSKMLPARSRSEYRASIAVTVVSLPLHKA